MSAENKHEDVPQADGDKKEEMTKLEYCKYLAHHKGQNDVDLYCNNPAGNWVYICGGLAAIWVTVGLTVFLLLSAILEYGTTMLWVYFIVFWFFVAIVVAALTVGTVERNQALAIELEEKEKAKASL